MAGVRAATVYVVTVAFSLMMLGLYIAGTARYLTNVEENTCAMTYMFEYPQYVRISLDEELDERYPRFGLYAYGEGFVTQKLRRMQFSGIPVLFIPGNGGSHEQARSLASVSLRKSIDDRTSFHFDYFTVSLGKDYSALYGGVLEDETTYVSLCTSRILSLYREKVDKIVLIGHSMGGIIAKAVLLRTLSRDSNNVQVNSSSLASILVTLASPHKPIFLPDRTISRYYDELESSASRFKEMETSIVSIGGGERDVIVGSSQTIDSSADLNIMTNGMPNVWRSTDHLCILWCKQLILTIVRALFDCVDRNARPPTITSDASHKLRALSYHLTSGISGKRLGQYKERYEFERGAEWIEDIRSQYTWTNKFRDYSNKTVFLMFRLESPSYDSLTLESINLEAKDWVFACSAYSIEGNSRVCEWGWNLTNRTNLFPDPIPHRPRRKKLCLSIEDIRNFKLSHIVVRIPASELRGKNSNLVKIHVDLYRSSDRTVSLKEGNGGAAELFFNIFRVSSILTPNPYGSVESSRGSLTYNVFLTGIEDAVSVDIEPINKDGSTWTRSKTDDESDENPQAVFQLLQDSSSHGSSSGQVRAITFKDGGTPGKKRRVVMHLIGKKEMLTVSLGAEHSYRMIIRRAGIIERVACSVRDRWPTLYPIILALCLLGVATRIDDSPNKTAITCGITLLLCAILDCIFETFVAIGLIHVFIVTTCCLVVFFGSVAHNIAARFLARIAPLPNSWFDWFLSGLERVPIFTTFILLLLISATCGAIAILLSVALFFLKLTRTYDEYVEELLMASLHQFNPFRRSRRKLKRRESFATESTKVVAGSPDSCSRPHVGSHDEHVDSLTSTVQSVSRSETSRESILNTLLLFVTWSFVAIPSIPSALVWAKNFRYETRLTTEDPAMLISWLVLTCWGSLGLVRIPPIESNDSSKLRRLVCVSTLRLVAWILLCTAHLENSAHYQWIVPPLVALCITCVSLLSLFSASSTS